MRSRRLTTLQAVADLDPLPIDAPVADVWAELRPRLAGSGRRMDVDDTWIAATALAHDVPVVTQDDDFDVLAGLSGLHVIHV
ncbi:PIN domain-containing protein [Geodermatophilus sp. SYSU D01186]